MSIALKAIFVRHQSFLRFLLIGAANTAFSYGVYSLFLALGLAYVYASFLALVLGIMVSFKTQSVFVFGNRDNWRIIRFAACWGVIYFANIALIALFLRWSVGPYVAGLMALPLVVIFSYFVQKYVVFAKPQNTQL